MSATPRSSTNWSNCLLAGRLSFFSEVAIFQIAPSGARTTPPKPQKDLAAGLSVLAPASRAASMRALALAGWGTVSDSVYPRKPVDGASEARRLTWGAGPKGVREKSLGGAGGAHW